VATAERRVADGATDWASGAVVITIRPGGLTVAPAHSLAYYPAVAPVAEAPSQTFEEVYAELRNKDPGEAYRLLEQLARDPNPVIRASAINQLAGIESRDGRAESALADYRRLLTIDNVAVDGAPISLLAHWARCGIYEALHDRQSLQAEAEGLWRDLQSGRWMLSEAMFRLYARDAGRWLEQPSSMPPGDHEVLAATAALLWADRASWPSNSREVLSIGDRIVTVLKVKVKEVPRALIATSEFVNAQWVSHARALGAASGVDLSIGVAASGTSALVRSPAQTGLPWSVATQPALTSHGLAFEGRRQLWLSLLAVLVVIALGAAYVIVRAVNREIAVARLQSDFVAAVSHEFRTPLTALRQFTGMLSDGTAADEATRKVCYDAQGRATDRLTRLVESVLDFGRMEAGAKPYHFEIHDCVDIVGGVVEDFRREARAHGYRIEFAPADTPRIEVDREALSRAIWNLLDNAVKYSPGRQLVEVGLNRRPDGVAITVRDYGIGVPVQERQAIFNRFARGGEAQTRGINGTGIGLSMVDHIVRAHRGRIELQSEPGKGSSFTLVLPARG
jgi:signal transduction histidine kinase